LAVALAEAFEHLVVNLPELVADLLDLLGRESLQWVLDSWRCGFGGGHMGWFLLGLGHSSTSTGPSGAFTQVRQITPSTSDTSPLRRSRSFPLRKVPTQVWQMPIRQPKGRSRPASSPATRIGVPPSHSTSLSLF